MKIRSFLLVVMLTLPLGMLAQDEKSPDLQQQRHNQNDPPSKATAPNAQRSEPQAGPAGSDPGNTSADAKKTKKKRRAKQAHGTPDPSSTSTAH